MDIFEEQYKDDLSIDEAIALAVTAINEATEHDTTSDNVEIAVIRKDDGNYVKLSKDDVTSYIEDVLNKKESKEDVESEDSEESEE